MFIMFSSDNPSPDFGSLPVSILFNKSFFSIGRAFRSMTTITVRIRKYHRDKNRLNALSLARFLIKLTSLSNFSVAPGIRACITEGLFERAKHSFKKSTIDWAKGGWASYLNVGLLNELTDLSCNIPCRRSSACMTSSNTQSYRAQVL